MLGMLVNLVIVAMGLLLVLWVVWAAIKYFKPGLADTVVGAAISRAVDTSQAISAYGSLTAIRCLDSVEADKKAIEACDYLRVCITAWKRDEVKKAIKYDTGEKIIEVPAGYKLVKDD